MTNNTVPNVPRELLERILYLMDNYIGTTHTEEDELRTLLSATSPAGVGGMEVIGWYTEDHLDDKSATTYSWAVAERWVEKGWPVSPLYAAPVSESKAQDVVLQELRSFEKWWCSTPVLRESKRTIAEKAWRAARIEAAPSAGKEVEAPGPAPVVKLCVACRTLHPVDHFDKAAPDFPTRDGLNCNCRKSVAERGYHLMRLPNGKVEPRP